MANDPAELATSNVYGVSVTVDDCVKRIREAYAPIMEAAEAMARALEAVESLGKQYLGIRLQMIGPWQHVCAMAANSRVAFRALVPEKPATESEGGGDG